MANPGVWARRVGFAILALFAFLTVFKLRPAYDYQSKVILNGDDLARSILAKRQAPVPIEAPFNNTNGLEERAPNFPSIRSATDDVWNRASDKGNLLKCWMKDPTAAGSMGSSKWNDYGSLKEWGWIETTTTHYGGEDKPGMKEIVGPVDEWSNDNKIVRFKHSGQHPDQEITEPDGSRITVSYPPTNANYDNKIYPGRGVIIADSNWNPRVMIEDEQTSKGRDWDSNTMRQPDLFQMSDFWWFMWRKYTSATQRLGLRAIAKHNIINIPTQQVVARALKLHWPNEDHPSLGRAPEWPGKTFTPDMEGFAAVLGINSIWGVPFFLIQHHTELGKLEVKKITVWTEIVDQRFYQPSAVVEIGKVED